MTHRTLSFRQTRTLTGVLVLAALLLSLDMADRPAPAMQAKTLWPPSAATGQSQHTPQQLALVRVAGGVIPMPAGTPAAHASNLLVLPPGDSALLAAFWFAGTTESAPDVQIAMSRFDRATQVWTPARFVVNRHAVADVLGFGVRRLGNPVAWLDGKGRVHLFVVATGLGGWAASRILHLRQADGQTGSDDLRLEAVRVLPLSWLWNTSHLVRAMPLPLADGGMVLPVYFELGIKYPMLLRFDAEGRFRGMHTLSRVRHWLQPTVLALGESEWIALMRDQGALAQLGAVKTTDGGSTWHSVAGVKLANHDASIVGLTVQPGQMVLAHNAPPAAQPNSTSRALLVLSQSGDAVHWQQLAVIAEGGATAEFSYPAMAWTGRDLWVSYTDQRQRIGWQRFSVNPALLQ